MNLNNRIEWVDTVKYVCISLVILSHLESCTWIWTTFYAPFFVTAFFFVSGYFHRSKQSFKCFIYKKVRQLFIPWLLFSVFNILIWCISPFYEHDSIVIGLFWNFLQIGGHGDELWFVAALFIDYIPFYFLVEWYEILSVGNSKKAYRITTIYVVILWLLSLGSILYTMYWPSDFFPWNSTSLPWHIEGIFPNIFYMFLGYLFRSQFEFFFDRFNTSKNRIVTSIIYLLLAFGPYFQEMRMTDIEMILHRYVASIVGLIALISIAKIIKTNKFISFVGQNTLIYFALHSKVLGVIEAILKRDVDCIYEAILDNIFMSSIFSLVLALMVTVVLVIPAYIINKWIPFVVGKNGKEITHEVTK